MGAAARWLDRAVIAALLGCGALDDPAVRCEMPLGIFDASYQELSGDCGTLEDTPRLAIDGPSQVATIERRVDANITTEDVLRGCELRIVQTVSTRDGLPTQQIEIDTRASAGEVDTLRGSARLSRFTRDGTMTCEGQYEAILTRVP